MNRDEKRVNRTIVAPLATRFVFGLISLVLAVRGALSIDAFTLF